MSAEARCAGQRLHRKHPEAFPRDVAVSGLLVLPGAPERMSLVAPQGTQRVLRHLVQFLREPDADVPRLAALAVGAAPRQVVAVDGSQSILAESGDALLAAYRAGSVRLGGGASRVPPPDLVLLTPDDARAQLAERLEEAGLSAQGLPRIDASGALDALRGLAESQECLRAVGTLGAGDLLLVDGALQARAHAPLLDRLLAEAARRAVDVVGVCKSTSLRIGHAPALVACRLAARAFASPTWLAPLATPPHVRGTSYAARLSAAEERVFRFDVAAANGRSAADVLAGVAALCGHPAYPGYPSPLAMAHNAVLLNEDTRRQLRARVHEAAMDAGVDERAWDAAFTDYHEILELGA